MVFIKGNLQMLMFDFQSGEAPDLASKSVGARVINSENHLSWVYHLQHIT